MSEEVIQTELGADSPERADMLAFLADDVCPNCGEVGRAAIGDNVRYTAPLQWSTICECGYEGWVGYKNMNEKKVVLY